MQLYIVHVYIHILPDYMLYPPAASWFTFVAGAEFANVKLAGPAKVAASSWLTRVQNTPHSRSHRSAKFQAYVELGFRFSSLGTRW